MGSIHETSAILYTPLEIYKAVKEHFPCARLEITQNEPPSIRLTFADGVPSLTLSTAVNQDPFIAEITTLSLNHNFAKHLSREIAPLDPSRFTAEAPLSNWQEFQRIQYGEKGMQTPDILQRYLQNPQNEEAQRHIEAIGLAPSQIEDFTSEEDMVFFARLKAELPDSSPIIDNLRTLYPKIAYRLAYEEEEDLNPQADEYTRILKILQGRVIGQELATHILAAALVSGQVGRNHKYLFVGPTGTGKTELANAASMLKENHIVTFHLNQLTSHTAVSTLFGSDAGYVGSTSKPQLAKAFEKFPGVTTEIGHNTFRVKDLVILFDEIEKAHPELQQSLLTLCDEGKCVIRYTQRGENEAFTYILEGCIIITTSNLFQSVILEGFQRGDDQDTIEEAFKKANMAAQSLPHVRTFSPEWTARMSKLIPFGPIPRGEPYQKLLDLKLEAFLHTIPTEFKCREVVVEDKALFLQTLEDKLYGEGVDIRRVARFFEHIQGLIYQNMSKWGDLTTKKLIFYVEGDAVKLKLERYSPFLRGYVATKFEELKLK